MCWLVKWVVETVLEVVVAEPLCGTVWIVYTLQLGAGEDAVELLTMVSLAWSQLMEDPEMPFLRAKEVSMVSLESHLIIQKIVGIRPLGLDGKVILQ